MSNKETQIKMENLKEKLTLVNGYIDQDANEVVKQFVKQIKNSLPGARLKVQGTEVKSLKEFGAEILKRDGLQIGTATFYAGFDDRFKCTLQNMTMSEIEENLKTKTLTFFKVHYTGAGCWGF